MRISILLLVLVAWAQPVAAKDKDTFQRVACRVVSTGPVIVDRGSSDGVAVGDRVFFYPRGGTTHMGAVVEVNDRSAAVDMRDRDFVPAAGTRGEVLIPTKRLGPAPEPETPKTPAGKQLEAKDAETEDAPDHPEWENKDTGWRPGQPLLSGLRPVRPEQRTRKLTGRAYVIGQISQVPDSNYDNSLLRVGTEIVIENLLGKGGTVHLDIESGYLTDRTDHSGLDLLLRQLSYARGGTRFDPMRWEAGRFLQHGMPEFGMLDGGEWSYRRENGHRFGFSMGFMPEPDDGLESVDDFQIAGFYEWIADLSEQLTLTGGFQKTWHNGAPDRDLLVGKIRFLPGEGWDFHATVWIDFGSGDSSIEVSQAQVFMSRRWKNRSGVDVTLRHLSYPELRRNEFLPVLADQLDDSRYDRLGIDGWKWLTQVWRLHGHLSGWNDEDGSGASGEIGLDIRDMFVEGSRIDLVVFVSLAQFEDVAGARGTVGRSLGRGRWDVYYEFALHRVKGFPGDRDDLIQHRVRGSATFFIEGGWDVSGNVEVIAYDREFSWSLGFTVQRRF